MAKKKIIGKKTAKMEKIMAKIDAMSSDELISRVNKLAKKYRVTGREKFNLAKYPTRGARSLSEEDKPVAKKLLAHGVQALAGMQDKLYAQDKWALLVIFQAMDAAGKDGAIKHVMSGINPQGCEVTSFKAPSAEELDHDYLWRCMKKLPERGRIGIFNRSYYEEVLVVRVHESFLNAQKIPDRLVTKNIWKQRLEDITNFEKYLANNGIMVVKIFLNVSRKEQKERFLERIDTPEKNWKFSSSDLAERKYWDQYMACYQEMIGETSTPKAPWYVVPADNKPFARIVVAAAILHAMDSMGLAYPKVDESQVTELQSLRSELLAGE